MKDKGEKGASFVLHKHDVAFRSCGTTILYPKELRMAAKPRKDDFWRRKWDGFERCHYNDWDEDGYYRAKRKWRSGRKAFIQRTLDRMDVGLQRGHIVRSGIFCLRRGVKWPCVSSPVNELSAEVVEKLKTHSRWCRENPYEFELRADPKTERMILR